MTGSDTGFAADYLKAVCRCHGCLPARGVHLLTLLPCNSLRYRHARTHALDVSGQHRQCLQPVTRSMRAHTQETKWAGTIQVLETLKSSSAAARYVTNTPDYISNSPPLWCNALVQRVKGALMPIWKSRSISVEVKRILLLTCVRPIVEYGSEVWFPSTARQLQLIDKVQTDIIKCAMRCGKERPCSSALLAEWGVKPLHMWLIRGLWSTTTGFSVCRAFGCQIKCLQLNGGVLVVLWR
ncbi:hypothetical protein COO60DRAFT_1536644 [Scenedesmus sp. NREL 46B-D3]|nr:hypothetical protein COO60DRAFT_1536644 [Scenedesmus sp. NREL 46B-D3]